MINSTQKMINEMRNKINLCIHKEHDIYLYLFINLLEIQAAKF